MRAWHCTSYLVPPAPPLPGRKQDPVPEKPAPAQHRNTQQNSLYDPHSNPPASDLPPIHSIEYQDSESLWDCSTTTLRSARSLFDQRGRVTQRPLPTLYLVTRSLHRPDAAGHAGLPEWMTCSVGTDVNCGCQGRSGDLGTVPARPLRRQDSNLDHRNQNPRCCLYTTAEERAPTRRHMVPRPLRSPQRNPPRVTGRYRRVGVWPPQASGG